MAAITGFPDRPPMKSGTYIGDFFGSVVNATAILAALHWRERRSVWQLDDPLYGDLVEYGPAPKLSETPGRIKWPARPVGFHNGHVFQSLLGLTSAEVRDLEEKGAIGEWADRPGAKPPAAWEPEVAEVL